MQLPLLMTSHSQAHKKQSFYSLLENRYRTICLPILRGKRILGSNYGWLVLADCATDHCCLWNPERHQSIQLPRLYKSCLYNRCVLSKPPTEPGCLALFNSSSTQQQSMCRIGDDRFVKISLFGKVNSALDAISSFQGEIYGIINGHMGYGFVIIHLVGKTIGLRPLLMDGKRFWEVPSKPRRSWVTLENNYLIRSPCELLLVTKMIKACYMEDGVEFRVFRVDDVNGMMELVELENIDGRTIFVGFCGNGFCCSSSGTGTKPNSIYYTNEKGRLMYVYDLDDRSTTALLPCPAAGRNVSVNYWVDFPYLLDS